MHRARAGLVVVSLSFAGLALPGGAFAGAPGWSTPHTASAVGVGVYGAGPNGQGVRLYGSTGAAQERTPAMRAIRSDATQGSAVPIDAGQPGIDQPAIAVNAAGRLVAAWTLDTLQPGRIGLAATLGARTALPRAASPLPTAGSVTAVADAIAADGTGVVAWVESGTPNTVRAATLRTTEAPEVVTIGATTAALPGNLSLGLDANNGRPIVTWTLTTAGGTAIDIARGDGTGRFAATSEQALTTGPVAQLQAFVQAGGGLTALWSEGALPGPLTVRTADAPAGAPFGTPRTLATAAPSPLPAFTGGVNGRSAAFYGIPSGSGVAMRIVLRSTSGSWGNAHMVGPNSARTVKRASAGVDATGRVVVLWDDGGSGSSPTRILAARSSSSSDPPGTYHQLPQRSGDSRCATPTLVVSSSGDGLGSWQCSTSTAKNQPRLARLTKPS
jgi:hypothetical protein